MKHLHTSVRSLTLHREIWPIIIILDAEYCHAIEPQYDDKTLR